MPALAAEYVVWPIEPCIPAPEEVLMTRATRWRPSLASLRHQAPACRSGAKWPLRCTRITASHSSSEVFTSIRSRTKPGVVDQDVEAAEGVDRLLHHRRGLLEVGDVGAVGDGLAAQRLDLGDDLVGDLGGRALAGAGGAEVVDHDLGALPGELEGVGAADAATRSGDDRDASFEDAGHGSPSVTARAGRRGFAAAVALHGGAGDVAGQVGGEEGHDPADLGGIGHPAERDGLPRSRRRSRHRRSGRRSARCGTARRRRR